MLPRQYPMPSRRATGEQANHRGIRRTIMLMFAVGTSTVLISTAMRSMLAEVSQMA